MMTANQIPNPIKKGISPVAIAREIHRVAQSGRTRTCNQRIRNLEAIFTKAKRG
jgi:hypothetical protein